MPENPDGLDWSTRLAQGIAAEVRRHRDRLGISAQQLSERCTELGMPIQRSVLSNLESGRRTTVTVAEVLVLARALHVPPASLIFPAGYIDLVLATPHEAIDPLGAIGWVGGTIRMHGEDPDYYHSHPMFEVRRHQGLAQELERLFALFGQIQEELRASKWLEPDEERLAYLKREQETIARERQELLTGEFRAGSAARHEALSARLDHVRQEIADLRGKLAPLELARYRLEDLEVRARDAAEKLVDSREKLAKGGYVLPELSQDVAAFIRGTILPDGRGVATGASGTAEPPES